MSKKNYNIFALQGQDVDDLTFRDNMKEAGIDIPIDLMNKPELNQYVIDEMYKQNVNELPKATNPVTGELYTAEEAVEEAAKLKSKALDNVKKWSKSEA